MTTHLALGTLFTLAHGVYSNSISSEAEVVTTDAVSTSTTVSNLPGEVLSALAAPLVLGFFYACIYCLYSRSCTSSKPDATATLQGFGCFGMFASKVLFTKLIPESYAIAHLCGFQAWVSGLLVSVYPGAHAFGYAMVWYLYQSRKNSENQAGSLSSTHLRRTYAMSVAFLTVGTTGFAVTVACVEMLTSMWLRMGLMVFFRSLAGVGGGVIVYVSFNVGVRTGTKEEWPLNTVRLVVASAAGSGCGPLLASVSQIIREIAHIESFQFYDDIVLCLIVCLGVYRLANISAGYEAMTDEARISAETIGKPKFSVRSVIMWCALLCAVRAGVMSDTEVATSLVLERDAGWPRASIGLVIGGSFLLAVLMKTLLERIITSTEKFAVTLLAGALFATFLMSRTIAMGILGNRYYLLLVTADVLLLPQIILAGGFMQGIMLSLPNLAPGTVSLNNVQLLLGICNDGIGRLIGPPMTRWVVTVGGLDHGQDMYSIMQFSGVLFIMLIAKVVVLPVYTELKQASDEADFAVGHELVKLRSDSIDSGTFLS